MAVHSIADDAYGATIEMNLRTGGLRCGVRALDQPIVLRPKADAEASGSQSP
jgi:hypothetical protein